MSSTTNDMKAHALMETREEPRFLQTLEKFALDPAYVNALYGAALWLGLAFWGLAAAFYWKPGIFIIDPNLAPCIFPLLIMLAGPFFGFGLHGSWMLRRRLGMYKAHVKRTTRESEPIKQPKRTPDQVYDVAGVHIARHRQPKTVTYGPDRHVFSGDDLDLLERSALSGDYGIRRDTSAAGWGWMDPDKPLSGITSTRFGLVKRILVKREYATDGSPCTWTTRGLREILELDVDD